MKFALAYQTTNQVPKPDLLAHLLSSSTSISFCTSRKQFSRERDRNGVVDSIPNGGCFSCYRSGIFAGDLRIELQKLQCAEAFGVSQIGPSPQLLHRLGRLSLGHLHRRHHHVQVTPIFPLLNRKMHICYDYKQEERKHNF